MSLDFDSLRSGGGSILAVLALTIVPRWMPCGFGVAVWVATLPAPGPDALRRTGVLPDRLAPSPRTRSRSASPR
ncbi:MAG TPA: hypothetical protein VNK43_00055 [Gemmatimonadales bacterium]|nr:hypothetical protein [Gemmatimonadales bacterium]